MNPELRLRIGWVVVGLLFCGSIALFAIDVSRWNRGEGAVYGKASVGRPAPDVSFQTLGGGRLSLTTFVGHPLVVNFFATWCVPCKAELPLMQSRYAQYRSRGLEVLGADQQEDAPQVRAFVRAHGVTYPTVIDQGDAIDVYGGHAIPMSLFIDSTGVLRAVHVGEMSAAMLDEDLRKIL